MDIAKAEILSKKMNDISEKFRTNLDIATDMDITGNDIIEVTESEIEDIDADKDLPEDMSEKSSEVLNLSNLIQDFKFIRETLHENIVSGRGLIKSITTDIQIMDPETAAPTIASFAELNRALTENMRLYLQTYKEISNVLLNLQKIKTMNKPKTAVNNLNISNVNMDGSSSDMSQTIISTAELIKQLSIENKDDI